MIIHPPSPLPPNLADFGAALSSGRYVRIQLMHLPSILSWICDLPSIYGYIWLFIVKSLRVGHPKAPLLCFANAGKICSFLPSVKYLYPVY